MRARKRVCYRHNVQTIYLPIKDHGDLQSPAQSSMLLPNGLLCVVNLHTKTVVAICQVCPSTWYIPDHVSCRLKNYQNHDISIVVSAIANLVLTVAYAVSLKDHRGLSGSMPAFLASSFSTASSVPIIGIPYLNRSFSEICSISPGK